MEAGRYAPVPGKIPGPVINLGGHDLIVAPLNLDGVQAFEPMYKEFGKIENPQEMMKAGAAILHLSLVRNYPDMTVADVERLMDMGNCDIALRALVTAAGMKIAPVGETPPPSL